MHDLKLSIVTAVFNAIKSGNRDNLIRCVRSVAALKTEHEHLIYDGGSTDGTVELLRELEREVNGGGESKSRVEVEDRTWLSSSVDAFVSNASDGSGRPSNDAIETIASTIGGESGALGDCALSKNDNSANSHFSLLTSHSILRVVSEPDTGIYNALNKGVRDARGEWFYVLGSDDYIFEEEQLIEAIEVGERSGASLVASPVAIGDQNLQVRGISLQQEFSCMAYPHQGLLVRTTTIRKFGGFNDRYRIAGDFDLTLRMLLGGIQVAYYHKAFSHYGTNGLSSKPISTRKEYRAIKKLLFGLSGEELDAMDIQKVLPSRVVLPLLFNRSATTRRAARYHLMRSFAKGIGLMTPHGTMIWNKK